MRARIKGLAILVAALLLPVALPARAEYVTDDLHAALRTGPGLEYRIITFLKSGTPLTVLSTSGEWTEVSSGREQQGWMESRVISTGTPLASALSSTRREAEKLREENTALTRRLGEVQSDHAEVSRSGEAAEKELSALKKEFERWKTDQANVVALRSERDALKAKAAEDESTIDLLEMKNRKLNARSNVYWAIYGTLVVLVGYVLGYLYASNRGRGKSGYRF